MNNMWVTRDKNGTLKLWKCKPVRFTDRLKDCAEWFRNDEERLSKEVPELYNDSYWTFDYQTTSQFFNDPLDYIDPEDTARLEAKYVIYLDENLYPNLKWEDDPMPVDILPVPKTLEDIVAYSTYNNVYMTGKMNGADELANRIQEELQIPKSCRYCQNFHKHPWCTNFNMCDDYLLDIKNYITELKYVGSKR